MTDTLIAAIPKPRLYWTYYPKSKRGYWRVSAMPKFKWVTHSLFMHERWNQAHRMASQMNEAESARIQREEVLRRARAL